MRGGRFFRPFFERVGASDPLRRFVLTELGSRRRHWHGLLHHALMLRAIGRAGHDAVATRHLIWSALFHEIVYDAKRSDNEEASAMVARSWLHGAEADAVAALILATKRHDLATDPVTRTFLEADLAILWTSSERLYAFYADGIRAEYAHVPDTAYRAGRAAVLGKLRDQLMLSLDPTRATRLARNLDGEIARLAAG